jgi:predicted SnoaL-like aldol condensation-catalyzing enzyme
MADPQKNKQTVIAYYNMAFNERKPAEAAQKYGGAHYIQHNPKHPTASRRSSVSWRVSPSSSPR